MRQNTVLGRIRRGKQQVCSGGTNCAHWLANGGERRPDDRREIGIVEPGNREPRRQGNAASMRLSKHACRHIIA